MMFHILAMATRPFVRSFLSQYSAINLVGLGDEIPLHVKIVTVYSYGFVVSWVPFNTSDLDHRKFLGYQIFYKKVDKEDPNMSIDDDRSACSDSWNMQFVTDDSDSTGAMDEDLSSANTPKGELVNQGVEANTMYAVYVQTRLINHPGARNAISKIHFVKYILSVVSITYSCTTF
jgi:hypothetical protein